MFLFTLHDFFLLLVTPGQAYLLIITRDDVVGQRHKLGSAFLSYFSWESKIALFFFKFTVSRARPKKLSDFIGCNFESRASRVGLHEQKKDTASAKEGKVSLRRRGRRSQGFLYAVSLLFPPALTSLSLNSRYSLRRM